MSVISVVPESNRNSSAREQLDDVQRAVQPHIDAIARHPVFHRLTSILALRVFMEHHVFAVRDFMSLLKGNGGTGTARAGRGHHLALYVDVGGVAAGHSPRITIRDRRRSAC
jgi:hypothetical protein